MSSPFPAAEEERNSRNLDGVHECEGRLGGLLLDSSLTFVVVQERFADVLELFAERLGVS